MASAFMSPLEARNNTNRNGVRMFGADKFSKTVLNEKWDRVKIVCSQPFNKVGMFGYSFDKRLIGERKFPYLCNTCISS